MGGFTHGPPSVRPELNQALNLMEKQYLFLERPAPELNRLSRSFVGFYPQKISCARTHESSALRQTVSQSDVLPKMLSHSPARLWRDLAPPLPIHRRNDARITMSAPQQYPAPAWVAVPYASLAQSAYRPNCPHSFKDRPIKLRAESSQKAGAGTKPEAGVAALSFSGETPAGDGRAQAQLTLRTQRPRAPRAHGRE